MSTWFLTGATGAVGSAVVPLLLAKPHARVQILIRAGSKAELRKRLNHMIDFWGWRDTPHMYTRIHAFRGDVCLPDFGLDAAEYRRLLGQATHVIHCAASVRMNETLDTARRSALDSARQIIALCAQLKEKARLQKLDFVSTVGIGGKRPGLLPETWIEEPRSFHNTYEQSKAEAEILVRQAAEELALPLTVHRPSMVIGDSRDGRIVHFQIFYFLCEFLSGRKTFGLYPAMGDTRLDVIPVDWVADAIVAASRDPSTAGRIFHLCSGPQLSPRVDALAKLVRDAFSAHGLPSPQPITIPRAWFSALTGVVAALSSPKRRRTLRTLPIYLDYLADTQGFDNREYAAWLQNRGMRLPVPEAYLYTVLGRYLNLRDHGRT